MEDGRDILAGNAPGFSEFDKATEEKRLKGENRITTDPEVFLRNNIARVVEDYSCRLYLICEDGKLITFKNRVGKVLTYKQTPWMELRVETSLSIDDLLYEWDLPSAAPIDFFYNNHRLVPLQSRWHRSQKETYWEEIHEHDWWDDI